MVIGLQETEFHKATDTTKDEQTDLSFIDDPLGHSTHTFMEDGVTKHLEAGTTTTVIETVNNQEECNLETDTPTRGSTQTREQILVRILHSSKDPEEAIRLSIDLSLLVLQVLV